jgi:hypothetical protein
MTATWKIDYLCRRFKECRLFQGLMYFEIKICIFFNSAKRKWFRFVIIFSLWQFLMSVPRTDRGGGEIVCHLADGSKTWFIAIVIAYLPKHICTQYFETGNSNVTAKPELQLEIDLISFQLFFKNTKQGQMSSFQK